MKRSVPKPKKFTLHEYKKKLFPFAQSVKNIADRLEWDSIVYDIKLPRHSAIILRDKANLILKRL